MTNLSLGAGTTSTSVNVLSIVQDAASANRDLIVAYVNNSSNYGLTNVSSASITVTGYITYDLPVITGTQANQVVALGSTFEPFSMVTVSDPGNPTGAGDSAAIQIQLPLLGGPVDSDFQGTLSFETGYIPFGKFLSIEDGDYELSGEASIADLQSDLRHLMFTPEYGGSAVQLDLQVQSAAGGETDNDNTSFVIVAQGGTVPCFTPGTHILTRDGEQLVEHLLVGDELRLGQGRRPGRIIWIGRRDIDTASHRNKADVMPILIEANAFGAGTPSRDLIVSPDHAMYFDGHLIPARSLTNGVTIRQIERTRVTYFHIELEEHSLIYAEGCLTESFLECGNRAAFQNGGAVQNLFPNFSNIDYQARRIEQSCAPFIDNGPIVHEVRRRLLQHARIPMTRDHATTVSIVDGEAVISSRVSVPGMIDLDPGDKRVLGVKIGRMMINGSDVPLDHPLLQDGWHGVEADGRWTNGRAVVPAVLTGDAASVELVFAWTTFYPLSRAEADQTGDVVFAAAA